MITRLSKILLMGAVALFYTLVAFNNVTDFDSNYQFVRHVLSMDSTFAGNRGMWRAMTSPYWHEMFYASIIVWEMVTMALGWWGAWCLWLAWGKSVAEFQRAKRIPIVALTLGMLMWLVAFLSVGAEWFLMWQSHTWNGQEAAFRMFAVVGIVLLILLQPETETSV